MRCWGRLGRGCKDMQLSFLLPAEASPAAQRGEPDS